MANINNKSNSLKKQTYLYLLGTIVFYIGAFIFWYLYVPLKEPIITMPGFLICGIIGSFLYKQYRTTKTGLTGEKETVNLLAKLPEDYYVFNDVNIMFDGKNSQIDNIIVSPNGVCIVETKNHKGNIVGKIEDRHWTQHKVGRKGTPYHNNLYNPIKQVKTHTWRLSQFLKEHNINVWVDHAVYFSNPEATVNIFNEENGKTPVFTYNNSDELLDYITSPKRQSLSDVQVRQIIHLLKSLN